MWNIYIEIIIAMRTTEKPELLHVANMKSPHSRVSLAATARSRTNQQEPPSAVLPVSYSAFIGVVTLQINDPVLAWGTQTLTPPVTKLLWPFESRRNTTPGSLTLYLAFVFLYHQDLSDSVFTPNFACVTEQSTRMILQFFGVKECSFAQLHNQICSASSLFCWSYDQKSETERGGTTMQGRGRFWGQRLRERKRKWEMSKEKNWHLAEGICERERSGQEDVDRREVEVVNTVERLRFP